MLCIGCSDTCIIGSVVVVVLLLVDLTESYNDRVRTFDMVCSFVREGAGIMCLCLCLWLLEGKFTVNPNAWWRPAVCRRTKNVVITEITVRTLFSDTDFGIIIFYNLKPFLKSAILANDLIGSRVLISMIEDVVSAIFNNNKRFFLFSILLVVGDGDNCQTIIFGVSTKQSITDKPFKRW